MLIFHYFSVNKNRMRKLTTDEIERLTPTEYRERRGNNLIVVLDNIRSLNNIGSVFRSSDAFGADAIYLCGISGTPPHREINKSALGATESVPWRYFKTTEEAISELKSEQFIIIAVEQAEGSVNLSSFIMNRDERYAVVFGNEVKGIGQSVLDLCDYCIEIPQYGTKHSMNIAVTAGIILWEFAGRD